MWMTITDPDMNRSSELFLFFFFPPLWNLMWRSRRRVWVVTEAHNNGGRGFLFRGEGRVWKKKGVKNQNGNDICHQQRLASCQPLMRLFPKWACKRGDLHCKLAAHWPFLQVDRRAGAWFPHTPHPSFPPPHTHTQNKCPTPLSLLTSACPKGLNRSHGGSGLKLSQADSPEQAHTVGALFQQQGLGRVGVKGRRPTALTGCK